MADPYPIVLDPILMAKVWGGRRLERFGKVLPAGELIGESWELADLDSTSASGGGGRAAHSTIVNGALAGRTVRDAMAAWGDGMLGRVRAAAGGGFPLLVKYLDAREHLSVQVHPSPEYARTHADAHLKTESWVVLEAAPGSVIYKGLRAGTTREDLASAIVTGRVPEVLGSVAAVVGECHTVPSGTVHALGAGVLVAEVQTPSDTTFRVYDWVREYGRPERALHVEEALACALFEEPAAAVAPTGARSVVAETAFYRIEVVRGGDAVNLGADGSGPMVVMVVGGDGATIAGEGFGEVGASLGRTVLIPAACARGASLRLGEGGVAVVASIV
ncbi:MAG: type I phosphomannose isomerase catalytic subunit [Phycisphaerales bacterium]